MGKSTTLNLNINFSTLKQLSAQIEIAKREAAALNEEAKKLRKEFKDTDDGAKKIVIDKKLTTVSAKAALASGKVGELKRTMNVLQGAAARSLDSQTAKWGQLAQRIDATGARFKGFATTMGGIIGVGGIIGAGAIAFQKFTRVLRNAEQAILDFDERIADIRKVTNSTIPDARALALAVSRIDTRTSVQGLLDLAVAGGRLGVSLKELHGFVEEADKLFIALGDTLTGSSEKIALTVGKIANTFKLTEDFGIAESLNKVGSILNILGANSAATEDRIIDFTNRLAGIASVAGFTVAEVAALGATFDAGGQSIEIAATSIQRFLPELATRSARFGEIVYGPIEGARKKFEEDLKKNPFEAFFKVLEKSKASSEGLLGLAETLGFVDQEAARAAQIFAFITDNLDFFTENLKLANEQLENNTSINQEAQIKQETLRGELNNLARQWQALVVEIDSGDKALSRFIRTSIDAASAILALFSSHTRTPGISFADNIRLEIADFFFDFDTPLELAKKREKEIREMNKALDQHDSKIRASVKTQKDFSETFGDYDFLSNLSAAYVEIGLDFEKAQERAASFTAEMTDMINQSAKVTQGAGYSRLKEVNELIGTVDVESANLQRLEEFRKEIERLQIALGKVDTKDDAYSVLSKNLSIVKKQISLLRGDAKAYNDELKRMEKLISTIGRDFRGDDELTRRRNAALESFGDENKDSSSDLRKARAKDLSTDLLEIDIAYLLEKEELVLSETDKLITKINNNEALGAEDRKRLALEAQESADSELLRIQSRRIKAQGELDAKLVKQEEDSHKRVKQLKDAQVKFWEELKVKTVENIIAQSAQNREIAEAANLLRYKNALEEAGNDPDKIEAATQAYEEQARAIENAALAKEKAALISAVGDDPSTWPDQVKERLKEINKTMLENKVEQTEALADIDSKDELTKEEKQEKIKDAAIDAASRLSGTILDGQVDNIEKEKDRKLDALDEEFDKKREAAKGNEALLANLEKQRENRRRKIEKDAAKKKQNIRILEAAIETALAVVRAAPDPFLMAFSAATGAAQLAIIKAQQFEKGGKIRPDGTIEGPSHSAGGVPLVISGTPIEAEGGERATYDESGSVNIINKRSAAAFRPLLDGIQDRVFSGKSRILSAVNSYNGYGVPLAQQGVRISTSRAAGIAQMAIESSHVSEGIKDAFKKMLPELSEAIIESTREGTYGGSVIGAREGAERGLIGVSQEAIEADRLLISRTA